VRVPESQCFYPGMLLGAPHGACRHPPAVVSIVGRGFTKVEWGGTAFADTNEVSLSHAGVGLG
jgi:hypothetical protein